MKWIQCLSTTRLVFLTIKNQLASDSLKVLFQFRKTLFRSCNAALVWEECVTEAYFWTPFAGFPVLKKSTSMWKQMICLQVAASSYIWFTNISHDFLFRPHPSASPHWQQPMTGFVQHEEECSLTENDLSLNLWSETRATVSNCGRTVSLPTLGDLLAGAQEVVGGEIRKFQLEMMTVPTCYWNLFTCHAGNEKKKWNYVSSSSSGGWVEKICFSPSRTFQLEETSEASRQKDLWWLSGW